MPDASLQTVRFQCIACKVRLQASSAKVGTEQRCPKCQAKFIVPSPPRNTSSASDDYELWEGTHQPTREARWAHGPFITVACRVCGTRLTATLDQVGSKLSCPDCLCQNLVPAPVTQELPKRRVLAEEGEPLEVEAPVESVFIEPLITSTGLEHHEENAHPVVLRRPLLSGILSFPFQLLPLISMIVLALGLMATVGIMLLAIAMAGFGAVAGVFFAAMGSVGGLLWASATAAFMLAICKDTALGHEKLVSWPGDGPVEWIIELSYLSVCIVAALIPGWVVAILIEAKTLGYVVVVGASFAGLFPILLLSTLEAGSALTLVSRFIWMSLKVKRWAWGCFYAESGLLLALLVWLGAPLVSWGPVGIAVRAVLIMAVLMIYFRLLGRLAWVCSDIAWSESLAAVADSDSSSE